VHTRRCGGKEAFFGKFALNLDLDQSGGSIGSEITVVTVQVV
jgi:hypothetical protein